MPFHTPESEVHKEGTLSTNITSPIRIEDTPPASVHWSSSLSSSGVDAWSCVSSSHFSVCISEPVSPPAPSKPVSLFRRFLECGFPLTAGMSLPVIGALNSSLKDAFGNVFIVTVIAYGLAGTLALLWSMLSAPEPPWHKGWQDTKAFIREGRWYNCFVLLGGVIGGCQHVCLTIITSTLGATMYVVGTALGQIIGSFILDLTGFAWSPKYHISLLTTVGCLTVCAGIVIDKSKILRSDQEVHLSIMLKILLIALTLIQGMATCLKSALGGKLSVLLGRHRRAVSYALLTGSGTAMAVFLGALPTGRTADFSVLKSVDPSWRFVSALLTLYVNTTLFIFQRRLSSAITYCCLIIGQLFSSAIMDSTGLLGMKRRPLTSTNVIGLGVFLFGIVLVSLGKLRRRKASLTCRPESQ
eukprot:Blabericola_migrator_1__8439@NODE_43_length_16904_cov_225_701966_g39_i0_p4_GENE_NODE_43_length_16904_cov_225_701966_g39_i0NODE_43_length_16904_cov_225_701966_g39_i0_p4_ORF_typecomplete_len413_score43_27DMT_YdcZ/PF04657_13/3_9e18DMT_YdcZ/PF04657_13/1_5e14_NODE_43_length_16904_cov_225_701966_g39_i083229560